MGSASGTSAATTIATTATTTDATATATIATPADKGALEGARAESKGLTSVHGSAVCTGSSLLSAAQRAREPSGACEGSSVSHPALHA